MSQRERAYVKCYRMSQDQVKEDDLVLAAQLGKALLERNHELTSEYYNLSVKLEVR